MSEAPRLSVVVPAYQESSTIEVALGRLLVELERLETSYEVIVVSDGSSDDTAERARAMGRAEIEVLEYHPNRGKGHAVRVGVERSRGEVVAFIDGDLDIHPSGIGRLLRQMEADHLDAVVGSKVHQDSAVHYPRFRRFQSGVFRLLVRRLFALDVADTQTGLKVFRRSVLVPNLDLVRSRGFLFDLELLVLINDAGATVGEGPVDLDYQFSTTTGAGAVVQMLRELLHLKQRRRRERRLGTWVHPSP